MNLEKQRLCTFFCLSTSLSFFENKKRASEGNALLHSLRLDKDILANMWGKTAMGVTMEGTPHRYIQVNSFYCRSPLHSRMERRITETCPSSGFKQDIKSKEIIKRKHCLGSFPCNFSNFIIGNVSGGRGRQGRKSSSCLKRVWVKSQLQQITMH